jgi:hypothetical protein
MFNFHWMRELPEWIVWTTALAVGASLVFWAYSIVEALYG